jgi:subtilisin family serine protease
MKPPSRKLGLFSLAALAACAAVLFGGQAKNAESSSTNWPGGNVVVRYSSEAALAAVLRRHPATITKRIPAIRFVELRPAGSPAAFAATLQKLPGIESAAPVHVEHVAADPGITNVGWSQIPLWATDGTPVRTAPDTYDSHGNIVSYPISGSWPNQLMLANPSGAYEWQWTNTNEAGVPDSVRRAAEAVTIAVVDTGADLTAPDIAAKSPQGWDVVSNTSDVTDYFGHGTFVASLAAGAWDNNEGVAGFGGDAKLLIVKATDLEDGSLYDIDIANAIVYAVDHGANIINLSLGGPFQVAVVDQALKYAVDHNVLVVAAAGNSYAAGNPISFPAGVVQPVSTTGAGGAGLAVAATDILNQPASFWDATHSFLYNEPPGTYTDPLGCTKYPKLVPPNPSPPCLIGYPLPTQTQFSEAGSFVSVAAPGEYVLGALSSAAVASAAIGEVPSWWLKISLPGSSSGQYGLADGTSFSSPEVAGIAALVWAADPKLTAAQVAGVIKMTAVNNPLHPAVSSNPPPPGTWNENLGFGVANAGKAVAYAQAWAATPATVNLQAKSSGTTVNLTWAATGSPAAASYTLYAKQSDTPKDPTATYQAVDTGTTASSEAVQINPNQYYSFLVVAYDAVGTPIASSNVVDASSLQSATAISLARTAAAVGHSPMHYHFVAKLQTPTGVAVKQQQVAMEFYDGYSWHRATVVRTKSDGTVDWAVVLRSPGTYRLRARFLGSSGFLPSTSSSVTLVVK